MDTFSVKAANSDDYESDVDTGTLPGQLSVLLAMLKISCFDNPVDNILVTSILVTSILVTNILVMKVPEPEKKGLTHYASKIKYYAFWHCSQNELLCSELCLTVVTMLVIMLQSVFPEVQKYKPFSE